MKRLVVYGKPDVLETIKAVWAGQNLRFEMEEFENDEQPKEEIPAEFTTDLPDLSEVPPVIPPEDTTDVVTTHGLSEEVEETEEEEEEQDETLEERVDRNIEHLEESVKKEKKKKVATGKGKGKGK